MVDQSQKMVNRLLEWANSDRKREKSDLYHDGRNVSNEFCNLEKKRENDRK